MNESSPVIERPAEAARPRRSPALALIAILLVGGSIAFAVLFTNSLDWHLRGVPEILVLLSFGFVALLAVATRAGRATFRRPTPYDRAELPGVSDRSRGRLLTALTAILAIVCLGLVGIGVADAVTPADTVDVSITSVSKRAQGLSTEIQTQDRRYQTPMFWAPTPDPGPARLSLGHFSGRVLRIEQ